MNWKKVETHQKHVLRQNICRVFVEMRSPKLNKSRKMPHYINESQ